MTCFFSKKETTKGQDDFSKAQKNTDSKIKQKIYNTDY